MVVQSISNSPSGFSVDNAYASIREKILSGELSGGSWLREGDLAIALGVSRTPVREALRRLMAEGLVQHHRNRGVRVQSWSDKDLDEIFALRSLLEPAACAAAATQGTVNLTELGAYNDQLELAIGHDRPDIAAVTEFNNLFHQLILSGAGNSQLHLLIDSIVQVPLVRRTFSSYSHAALRRSVAHHREIIDAIRAKDAPWAEAIMRAHIHAAHANLRGAPHWDTANAVDASSV